MDVNYKMGDTVLGTTVKEKDLGVTIRVDKKVSEQCGITDQIEDFKILNGYENIYRNMFYHSRNIAEPEEMR